MKQNETVQGILNAIELYAEAGRKASRELGEKAFTKEEATMSWVEKGVITTVPINALFDVLEQTGEEEVTYTVEDVTQRHLQPQQHRRQQSLRQAPCSFHSRYGTAGTSQLSWESPCRTTLPAGRAVPPEYGTFR